MNDEHATARRVLKYLIPVTVVSVVFNLPKFLEAEIEYVPNIEPLLTDNGTVFYNVSAAGDQLKPIIKPSKLRLDSDYMFYYNNWARLVVLGIVPFAMLVFFNTKIYQDIQVSNVTYRDPATIIGREQSFSSVREK